MLTFYCTDEEECKECQGQGQREYANYFEGGGYEDCTACKGTGVISTEKVVTIQQLKDLLNLEVERYLRQREEDR